MLIELRKLAEITPYPGNPRQNDAAVEAVAKSIREFDFRQPIASGDRQTADASWGLRLRR